MLIAAIAFVVLSQVQAPAVEGRYQENDEVSLPIRQEQHDQVARYLERLRELSKEKHTAFFQPDYTNERTYLASTGRYRDLLKERIGYPPPLAVSGKDPVLEPVAEDAHCTIIRVRYEVLEGVEAYGILSIPKGLSGPAPLLICQHGGGGSPELIANYRSAGTSPTNYGDMIYRALERGYIVYAPGLLFRLGGKEPIDGPERVALDKQLRYVGTSILAVECWKITRALDYLLTRPDIDPKRVGMSGLSYGGQFTLYVAALDQRIQAAVSSCYFNDRLLYGWEDWMFHNTLNEFTDAEVAGLICPRPLLVEVGIKDELFSIDGARATAPLARAHWEKLGISERFSFIEFDGGHEFQGDEGFAFLDVHVKENK